MPSRRGAGAAVVRYPEGCRLRGSVALPEQGWDDLQEHQDGDAAQNRATAGDDAGSRAASPLWWPWRSFRSVDRSLCQNRDGRTFKSTKTETPRRIELPPATMPILARRLRLGALEGH